VFYLVVFYSHFINIAQIQGTSILHKIFIYKVVECNNATVVVTQQNYQISGGFDLGAWTLSTGGIVANN